MNRHLQSQLDKVLALADSAHDGEAVVAVRKARQMLSRDGLSFGDLARAASKKSPLGLAFPFFASPPSPNDIELLQLRRQLDDLQSEIRDQNVQAEIWRQKAGELEQKLSISQAEAKRWRQLARDTVEKLWDLGQSVREDEFAPEEDLAKSA